MSEPENENQQSMPHPLFANSILAFFATCFANGILTSIKDSVPSIKEFIANFFGHHWIGHGIIILVFFILCMVLFQVIKLNEKLKVGDSCMVRYSILGSIIGVILILGFYVVHSL